MILFPSNNITYYPRWLHLLSYSVEVFVIASFLLDRRILRHIRRAVRLQRLPMSGGSPVGQSASLFISEFKFDLNILLPDLLRMLNVNGSYLCCVGRRQYLPCSELSGIQPSGLQSFREQVSGVFVYELIVHVK